MKQMTTPDAIAVRTQEFGEIGGATLFRLSLSSRKLVFLGATRGSMIFHFPVLEDGQVSRHSGAQEIWPDRLIDVLNPEDLGMGSEIRWTEERLQN
jgi:hypothetical protein